MPISDLLWFDAGYCALFKCQLRHVYEYPAPAALCARALPDAGHRRHQGHRRVQAALLRPAHGQPERYRAQGLKLDFTARRGPEWRACLTSDFRLGQNRKSRLVIMSTRP
jgi:hypothetical protein